MRLNNVLHPLGEDMSAIGAIEPIHEIIILSQIITFPMSTGWRHLKTASGVLVREVILRPCEKTWIKNENEKSTQG